MNYLITGGCGFLGKNLIKHLLQRAPAIAIRVVDNLKTGRREDLHYATDRILDRGSDWPAPGVVQLWEADILEEKTAVEAAQGADVIIHLAANTGVGPSVDDPRGDCLANVIGTLNYLEAARMQGIKRFVFASSGAPVGEVEPPIHEELAPHPVSPYGASKLAGEGYCSAYFRTFGVETVALRFGNVYGPGSTHKGSVVAKFIRQALAGEPWEIFGDGGQTRDFIFVEDLVEAVWLAATQPGIGGEIFQIATNRETTVGELAEMLRRVLLENDLGEVTILHGEARLGDVRRNFSDTTKAQKRLGWQAQTPLQKGLEATMRHFLTS